MTEQSTTSRAILATTTTSDLGVQSTTTNAILATSTSMESEVHPTMFTAVLASSTAVDSMAQQQPTSFSAILASSTTDMQTVEDPRFLTTIKAILARATTTREQAENQIAQLIQRALVKSQSDVELAMERLELLRVTLQQDLGPSDFVETLRKLGLLEDGPDSSTDVLSLFEQPMMQIKSDKPKRSGVKHDPWWYENSGYDEHGLPLDDDDDLTGSELTSKFLENPIEVQCKWTTIVHLQTIRHGMLIQDNWNP